ncbi:hypothetical protein EZV62_018040 [Acer yangbiense]|uniref:Uncharacterized protein n=1 Tax=Acer yangbiense TaxID=1000413 RepID=A0A5C7HIA3_9ROSI|nr:hypothetical protein EZV62_018040 [Acer yangbiense]
MHNLSRIISRFSSSSLNTATNTKGILKEKTIPIFCNDATVASKGGFVANWAIGSRSFSSKSVGGGGNDGKDEWESILGGSSSGAASDDMGWETSSLWSTGLTKEHFDGEAVGHRTGSSDSGGDTYYQSTVVSNMQEIEDKIKELEAENRKSKAFVDGWDGRMREMCVLLKQVQEPGARGSYLKDSEKAEMYRLHKENPDVYTVERLAKDYRIMRQRVHAILWLKELEEEEEKKLGQPLDDSVELLLDTCPEFFISHDREFHVASLPYKPDFKVMPEGWDGTIKDLDEVHYEISKKEDEMLYQEFVQRMNFNKMKPIPIVLLVDLSFQLFCHPILLVTVISLRSETEVLSDGHWMAGKVKSHRYSRRRPDDGWKFTVEKLGSRGKRGEGGGWKFVSLPDGSSRPLDEMEKMYVKRETPRHRRRILP